MTGKRWELIRSMAGAGPLTIRAAARRVGRDVKVHGDIHALLNAGILHKTESGRIVFPFDAIRVDVLLARGVRQSQCNTPPSAKPAFASAWPDSAPAAFPGWG